MKKRLVTLICLMVCFVMTPAMSYAFLYDIEVLEQSQIGELSDEDLMDKYIDVLVEMEASKTFHQNSGFSMDGYQKYKDLIRYRIWLSVEVEKRGLEVGYTPPKEEQ